MCKNSTAPSSLDKELSVVVIIQQTLILFQVLKKKYTPSEFMLVRPPLQLNHQTREQIEGSMSNILIHADFFNSV